MLTGTLTFTGEVTGITHSDIKRTQFWYFNFLALNRLSLAYKDSCDAVFRALRGGLEWTMWQHEPVPGDVRRGAAVLGAGDKSNEKLPV